MWYLQLDIYRLCPVLHKEAKFLDLQIVLLTEKKLRIYKRKEVKKNEETISNLWKLLSEKKSPIQNFWKEFPIFTILNFFLIKKCVFIFCRTNIICVFFLFGLILNKFVKIKLCGIFGWNVLLPIFRYPYWNKNYMVVVKWQEWIVVSALPANQL